MLKSCLQTPLDGESLCLSQIPEHQRKVEMEFYLSIDKLHVSALNQLISQHDLLSQQAGALNFPTVKGILKGFIDLTFEYQGRWYVLDYKSNWLGATKEAYSRISMAQAMIDHRYDLQYQLYSLALHRLLSQRIANYTCDQHFGGIFYLFLRGITPNDPDKHGIYDHKPSQALIEQLDDLFAGRRNNSSIAEETTCLSF